MTRCGGVGTCDDGVVIYVVVVVNSRTSTGNGKNENENQTNGTTVSVCVCVCKLCERDPISQGSHWQRMSQKPDRKLTFGVGVYWDVCGAWAL